MSEFYTPGRSNQMQFRSSFARILPDPATQLLQRGPDLITGKRSLAEFQQQQHQQQQSLGVYLRNVKPRMYQPGTRPTINSNTFNINNFVVNNQFSTSNVSFQNSNLNRNSCINLGVPTYPSFLPPQETNTKMMNMLQELEKELLDDTDEEVSGVINSEWSETFQNLLENKTSHDHQQQQLISLSPTSSSSSCSSTSASPTIISPKLLVIDAAKEISEGRSDAAAELLTRLSKMANVMGTPEQRLISYMVSALRSRVNFTQNPSWATEVYSQDHTIATHKLYDVSPCFKVGFMAANLAILEATMVDQFSDKLHVIDFDIGRGGQYVHLLHALATKVDNKPSVLKITTFTDDFSRCEEARVKDVGDTLKGLANGIGINLIFNVMSLKINDLSKEEVGLEDDEVLAVNFAFKLYKLPDESVTTENLRDEVLRRVKRLSPKVVTLVEQEMNCNTAPFVARVNEVFGYYNALFESLDTGASRESPDRVRLEEGLGRRMANSVACEGKDRAERCEVFGKWRARMGMAGFAAKPMSQLVADSLRSKLGSMTRGNKGFTVNEQSGGICFGWMGRSLTVASAWH